MTTKVSVQLIQPHIPVVIETVASDGRVRYTQTLKTIGSEAQEYVHSGQWLRVREMTTQEMADENRDLVKPREPYEDGNCF
jgi:hypothetical protein